MDLEAEAERLRLDLLAVQVSARLHQSGIEHVVLKGPSTSVWLYPEPRRYKDVDVLVRASEVRDAVRALSALAVQRAGGVGEEAEHSLLLHSTEGFEVDLHVSLPTLPPAGDALWTVLSEHVEQLSLDVGSLPVLDAPARCFVLCLHALNSGKQRSVPLEDLRRARARVGEEVWHEAFAIAGQLGADDLMSAGLSLIETSSTAPLSPRAYLYATDAPATALGLERLAQAPWRRVPGVVAREIVPSTGFMQHANPGLRGGRLWLVRAHLRRWLRLLRQLPSGARAWRASRDVERQDSGGADDDDAA